MEKESAIGLWNQLFGGADGCREAMRDSYAKHVRLAKNVHEVRESSHAMGLYGALGARYRARGINIGVGIWHELAPFLALAEQEAVEALAEYVLFQERPKDARITWLKEIINSALKNVTNDSQRRLAAVGVLDQVAWCALLTSDTMRIIEVWIDELRQAHERE